MKGDSKPFPWLGYLIALVLVMALSLSPVLLLLYVNATSGEPPLDFVG